MANEKAKPGSAARDERDIRQRPADEYDDDLARDDRRASSAGTMSDLADQGAGAGHAAGGFAAPRPGTDQGEFSQHARRGQAESPRELTPDQREREREGHSGGARDS